MLWYNYSHLSHAPIDISLMYFPHLAFCILLFSFQQSVIQGKFNFHVIIAISQKHVMLGLNL